MAREAKLVRRLDEVRVVTGAMDIMAAEAGDAAPIHEALHEIISLHAILVTGAFREMRETRLAELVFLQFPVIFQIQPLMKPDRPVVVLSLDRILQRLSLRMALDAGVAGANEI